MEILKNLLNEYKRINEKRLKTLFLFVTLDFICLGLHFITLYKPMLSACFLVVGCYLIYKWKQKIKSLNDKKDFFNDGLDLIQKVESVVFFVQLSFRRGANR
ncbi:hypothetical protein KVC07_02285 [Helicobacter pylori]|nr:hypothetical protein KVC07_02285 [Helicobacter pylori]